MRFVEYSEQSSIGESSATLLQVLLVYSRYRGMRILWLFVIDAGWSLKLGTRRRKQKSWLCWRP